jgi:hypothetical protein
MLGQQLIFIRERDNKGHSEYELDEKYAELETIKEGILRMRLTMIISTFNSKVSQETIKTVLIRIH